MAPNSQYESSIRSAAAAGLAPGFSNMLDTANPIASPQEGASLAQMWSTDPEKSSTGGLLEDLIKANAPKSIMGAMSRFGQEGEGALTQKLTEASGTMPTAPNLDTSGFTRASSNALGGKEVVPDVMKDFMAKSESEYQTSLKNWQNYYSSLQSGWGVLNTLKDPETAKAMTLDYMKTNLNQTLQYLQTKGEGVQPYYQALESLYTQSEDYAAKMNKFYSHTLGLQHDLGSDINESVLADNYSGWLRELVTPAKPATA